MTDGEIATKRLCLRAPRADDAAWIAREISVPEVQKWLTGPPHPFSRKDAEDWISAQAGKAGTFVIEGTEPLGVVGVHPDAGDFGLGYWLKTDAWGQGYMSEAAQVAIAWYFAQWDEALQSGYVLGNTGSQNVLEKLGFEPTEVIKVSSPFLGKAVDTRKMTLTKARWMSDHA